MKKKQAIAFLLSTTMTVSGAIPIFAAANDINGHWAEATIAKWQNEGKVGGYEDGTFKPDKTITRAEFVRLLNTTSVNTFTATSDINFSDVKASDWFYADVAKAVGSKVASGFGDGTFRPSETVTRAQAAVFICNVKALAPNEARANAFTDATQIPNWAKGAVGAAVNAGYLSGYPDGSFGANKGMTRAEAISTLDRLSSSINKSADPTQGVSVPSNTPKEKENNTKSGEMVWTNGGNGTSSKKPSGGGGSGSSSSSSSKYNNIKITSQADANKYKGATLKGTTEIYASENLTFDDVTFENVEVYAENTVASAYIRNDAEKTAVAAANNSVEVVILFNGKTTVSGNINVNRNNIADKVVIQVNTTNSAKRVARSLFAKVATVIRGPVTVPSITAEAPVFIENGANISTVEAKDNSSIIIDKISNVDTINATGDVKEIVLEGNTGTPAQINVSGDASVKNIEIAKDAEANVALRGNAEVTQVTVSDNATASVEVNNGAKIDTITTTSTGKTEIKSDGKGTVGKIEAADESTVEKNDNVETPVETITEVTSVAISGANEVAVGKMITLTATVLPSNATNKIVTWTSSDSSIATVSENGVVTGVKEGSVTITAKAGAITSTKTITVKAASTSGNDTNNIAVTSVTLNKTELTLAVDEKETLTATVAPNNATNKTVTWTSSDKTKATVDANGIVTGVAAGTATITATAGGMKAGCIVTVSDGTSTPEPVVSEVIVKANPTGTIAKGGKSTFIAEVTGTNLTDDHKKVTWEVTVGGKKIDVEGNTEEENPIATGVTYTSTDTTLTLNIAKEATIETSTEITVKATSVQDTKKSSNPVSVTVGDAINEVIGKTEAAKFKADNVTGAKVTAANRNSKEEIEKAILKAAQEANVTLETGWTLKGFTIDSSTTPNLIAGTNNGTVSGKFTVQNNGVDVIADNNVTITVAVDDFIEITAAETKVTGFTAPVTDAIPVTDKTKYTVGDSTKYEVTSVTWKKQDDNSTPPTAVDKFAASTTYVAEVKLTAKEGYKFTAITPTVDAGGTVNTAGTVEGESEKNTLTFIVTFPETKAEKIKLDATFTTLKANTISGGLTVVVEHNSLHDKYIDDIEYEVKVYDVTDKPKAELVKTITVSGNTPLDVNIPLTDLIEGHSYKTTVTVKPKAGKEDKYTTSLECGKSNEVIAEKADKTQVIETSTSTVIERPNTKLLLQLNDITNVDINNAKSKAGIITITERKTPNNIWTCNIEEDNSAAIGFTTTKSTEKTLIISIPFEYFKKGSEAFDTSIATPGTYDVAIPEGMFSYGEKIIKLKRNPLFRVSIDANITAEVVDDNVKFTFRDKNGDILTNLMLIDEEPKATITLIKDGVYGVEYTSKPLSNDNIHNGVLIIPISDFTDKSGNTFNPVAGDSYAVDWFIGDMGEGFRNGNGTDNPDTISPAFESLAISTTRSNNDINATSVEDLDDSQKTTVLKQEERASTSSTPETPSENSDKTEEKISEALNPDKASEEKTSEILNPDKASEEKTSEILNPDKASEEKTSEILNSDKSSEEKTSEILNPDKASEEEFSETSSQEANSLNGEQN